MKDDVKTLVSVTFVFLAILVAMCSMIIVSEIHRIPQAICQETK